MDKKQSASNKTTGNAEKPISLAPLSTTEALRGLLKVKPVKSEELKKASKKRTAKKAGSDTK